MPGELARAFVTIGADVGAAVRGIQQVNGQLGLLRRDAKRSSDAWSGFTGTLARTGLAIQGVRDVARAVRDIGGAIGGLALAADQQAVSQAQLEQSIAATGRALDSGLRAKLDDTLRSMEQTTLFTDNELQQALSVLVVGTGDVDEALRRLPISADLAAKEQIQLAQASRMLGRIDDDALTSLNRFGIGLGQAAQGSGDLAAAQMLAAKAGISVQGAMKAIGNESVRKRWGIPDPKDFRSAVSESALLAEAQRKLAGSATTQASGLAGGWAMVGKEFQHLKEDLGAFMLPVAKGAVGFLQRSLTGVRRLIMLFSTDVSGPRITSVRKLWKEIFGSEMPKALQVVVDAFENVRKRIATFVDDINSGDKSTVRAAVKTLFDGLKQDIGTALAELGGELDKQGLPGIALKLGIASIALEKVSGGLLNPMSILGVVRDALQIAWLTVELAGSGPAITILAALAIGLGTFYVIKQFTDAASRGAADEIVRLSQLAIVGAGLGILASAVAGLPFGVVVGAGLIVALSFSDVIFTPNPMNIGKKIIDFFAISGIPGVQQAAQGLKFAVEIFLAMKTVITDGGTVDTRQGTNFGGNLAGKGGSYGSAGGGSSGPVRASEADIRAAYARVSGGTQISAAYLQDILGQGFSKSQADALNIFTGLTQGDFAGGGGSGRRMAMGGSGIVSRPTLFMAGERGTEHYQFTPVGRSGGGGVVGGGPVTVILNGNVDSRSRISELGAEFQMRMARLQGSAV